MCTCVCLYIYAYASIYIVHNIYIYTCVCAFLVMFLQFCRASWQLVGLKAARFRAGIEAPSETENTKGAAFVVRNIRGVPNIRASIWEPYNEDSCMWVYFEAPCFWKLSYGSFPQLEVPFWSPAVRSPGTCVHIEPLILGNSHTCVS